MNVYASVALSGDGYMDDRSPRRLILSTPADWREVMRLRAWADAILVGAETVRRDDPSLTVRDEAFRRERLAANRPADPAKVTLSRSLRLAPASNFFTAGSGARIVFTDNAAASPLETAAEIVRIPDLSAARILTELEKRGFERLLVEGGPRTLGLFLRRGSSTRSAWRSIPPSASATRTPLVSNRLSIRHASRSSADGWKEWR